MGPTDIFGECARVSRVAVDNLVYRVVLESGEVATTKISMSEHLRKPECDCEPDASQETLAGERGGRRDQKVYDRLVNSYLDTR